jgi:septal ring factor EnvC (AmiA/AmiB activator)
MTAVAPIRRTLLVIGVLLSLAAAAATVEAASRWTASTAPLANGPASLDSIQQALAAQQSRSAVLEDQLAAMRAASDDLAGALNDANTQVSTDQATADQLRTALAAAQAKLAKLEAALKAQATVTMTTKTSKPATTTTTTFHDDDGGVDD